MPCPNAKPTEGGAAAAGQAGARRCARPDADARRRRRARAAPSPKPARAARASGSRPAAAPARARRSTSPTSAVRTISSTMVDAHPRELERAGRGALARSMVKFTIQRDGTHHRTSRSRNASGYAALDISALRAVLVDAAAAAAAGAVSEPVADRSPQFPIPTMNRILHTIGAVSIAAGLAIVAVSARPQQPPQPPAPAAAGGAAAAERGQHDHQQRRGRRAAAVRRARLHRAVERRGDRSMRPRRSRRCCGTI